MKSKILKKVIELLCIFLTTSNELEKNDEMMQSNFSDNCVHQYNVEILNFFDPELQMINNKPMIKNKLKEF